MLTRPTSSRAAPEEVGGTQLAKCFVHEHHPHPLAHWQPWDPCEAAAMGRGAVHWDGRSTGPAAARGGAAFIWGWCREFYSPGFFCALPSPYLVGSRLALARSWRIPPSVYSHNPANASIHIMEKTQSTRSLPLEQEFQLAKLQAGVRACNRDKRSSLVRLRCGSLLK